jgi:hypothetical protein
LIIQYETQLVERGIYLKSMRSGREEERLQMLRGTGRGLKQEGKPHQNKKDKRIVSASGK